MQPLALPERCRCLSTPAKANIHYAYARAAVTLHSQSQLINLDYPPTRSLAGLPAVLSQSLLWEAVYAMRTAAYPMRQ
ncbi:hypothetical protein FIBSPDRAFT_873295 [Athelia psychrophila]|uniref:Uncharacterized protein n=1 Tax=Athelia psychrophila TaxID=1759441 RepID=A0A165YQR4_9AGAM|nr:hypothetical protein FIBSPDRAFT_873295 [Fibularhizoctonia sp. CBS 109695]